MTDAGLPAHFQTVAGFREPPIDWSRFGATLDLWRAHFDLAHLIAEAIKRDRLQWRTPAEEQAMTDRLKAIGFTHAELDEHLYTAAHRVRVARSDWRFCQRQRRHAAGS